MNGKVIARTRKFFAMFLVVSMVLSLFAVGFTASADTDAVSASDVVTSGIVTEKDTVDTDTVSAADTVTASDVPVVSESDLMMFAAALAADDIASGTSGTCSWIIDANGKLTIYPTDGTSGTLASIRYSSNWPWFNHRSSVTSVVVEPGVSCGNFCIDMFYNMSNCTSMDLGGLNTSNVTAMNRMFWYCSSLTSVKFGSGFDTSKVTDMSSMFYECRKLTDLNTSNFRTSNVTNMANMFDGCESLTSLDVSGFDTSKVTDMSAMFSLCSGVTELDVSGWDTSNVTDISYMFGACRSLTALDLSGWNTSNVTTMTYMFDHCQKLASLNVSGFNTAKVTRMDYLFYHCESVTSLDLSSWDTSNVTTMSHMFDSCKALSSVDLSCLETGNVTAMDSMLSSCHSIPSVNITGWDTSNVTDMSFLFFSTAALTSLDLSGWDVSNVKNMRAMISNSITELDISGWDTSSVTNMSSIFNSYIDKYTVSGTWKAASDYSRSTISNFFDVKDGTLIYIPENNYIVKSVTIDGTEIDLKTYPDSYPGFTADMTATIVYVPSATVTFYADGSVVDTQEVAIGGDAVDPFADESKIIGVLGKHFTGWDQIFTNIQENLFVHALYVANDYVVVFNANGGEGTMAPQAFKYGVSQYPSNCTFTKEGYTFTGWNTEPDGSGKSYSPVSTASNLTAEHNGVVTFYAQWELSKYTVKFMNGINTVDSQSVEHGSAAADPYADPAKIPTYTGKHYIGWDKEFDNITSDLTVNAQYAVNEYTVIFDANGGEGTMASQAFKYGSQQRLTKNAFTRDGYEFAGWSRNANGSGRTYSDNDYVSNLSTEHNATVTLYAQWKLPPCTVTFMNPIDDLMLDEITIEYGDSVTPPEIPGTIIGWVTEKNGTTEADFNNITEDMVVWAVMRDRVSGTPSIEFEGIDNVFDIGEEIKFTAIGVWPEDINSFIPLDGDLLYVPVSWSTEEFSGDWNDALNPEFDYSASFTVDQPGEYVLKVEFMPVSVENYSPVYGDPVTFEAKYKIAPSTVTVTFEDNGTEVDKQEVAVGGDAVDPYADESKIIGVLGKHFTGWDKIFTNIQQDITVKALYEFNDYVLVFDANGGEGDMAPVAFKYDTAQEIPENTFTKEGYTFVGWNTAADLSGDSYDDKATVKNLTDEHDVTVTFYAQWLINTYSVSFMDSANDSLIEAVPVEHGESVTAPTVSNVIGWSTAKGGTTEADLSKVTGDMTVWAIYRDEYTGAPSVVFDKESKTFNIDEEIKFKAVGYWADSSTSEFIDGDERYVPTNWHHAEPSGDFGGKTAPTDTYSASFKQSAAGTYTLKVEFAKSVYQGGAWVDDGIVTVETEYKVVAPSAGETDVPKTGDSNGIVIIASNVMLLCAVGMFLTWCEIKRKKENA